MTRALYSKLLVPADRVALPEPESLLPRNRAMLDMVLGSHDNA